MSSLIEELYEQHIMRLSPDDQLLLMDRIVRGIAATNGADAIAWANRNRRRGELIYKEVFAGLSAAEQIELAGLQREADEHLRRAAPRPLEALARLESALVEQHAADQNES